MMWNCKLNKPFPAQLAFWSYFTAAVETLIKTDGLQTPSAPAPPSVPASFVDYAIL